MIVRQNYTVCFSRTYVLLFSLEVRRVSIDLSPQRLSGASLLVFANKQDIQGSMTDHEIEQVEVSWEAATLSL